MVKVKTIITGIAKEMGIESGILLYELQKKWHNLFDSNTHLHTYPSSLNNGVLTITVDSPIWLQEIRLNKNEILTKLNCFYIKDIKVKMGIIKHQTDSTKSQTQHYNPPENTPSWAQPMLEGLKDAEIRDSLRNIVAIISEKSNI
ncbi:MAG: DUF721 domain-containing protein [Thermodesulfovibrionales bacterium]|nr:DUF721 domain-containing protein [Thermodesulfovibrionales bacterium]